jgi:hypothetical protein
MAAAAIARIFIVVMLTSGFDGGKRAAFNRAVCLFTNCS